MSKKFLLTVVMILSAMFSFAQSVTWNFTTKTLSNGNIEIYFNATIPQGYRLYSPNNPSGASQPLKINLDESQDYSRISKIIEVQKPEEHYNPTFKVTEKFFTKKASFKVIITPSTDNFTVTGDIKGQACTEAGSCTMVRKKFSIDVE